MRDGDQLVLNLPRLGSGCFEIADVRAANLDVGLEFWFGARRPDNHPHPVVVVTAEEDERIRAPLAPLQRQIGHLHLAASRSGGVARSRAITASASSASATRRDTAVVVCTP